MIVRHTELSEFLIEVMNQVNYLKSIRSKELIETLDEATLKTFFNYDMAIGVYIHGGNYEYSPEIRAQEETVEVVLVVGSQNLSGTGAPLGSGSEPGGWDVLESLRELFTGSKWKKNGQQNVKEIVPKRWRMLHSEAGSAVLGMDMQVSLNRLVATDINLGRDIFGAGYGGENG